MQLRIVKPTFDQAMRDMISAHDDLILDLKKQLAGQEKKANALEEKYKAAKETIKDMENDKEGYCVETTINQWQFHYSTDNFLIERLMESLKEYADKYGIVNTMEKLNL